jgi:hypothetical protein
MAGLGGPSPNRIVTFLEVNFSRNWFPESQPNPDGFVNWYLYVPEAEGSGSISITRSDGKVLSFEVSSYDPNYPFIVQTQENIIRWTSYQENFPGSDGPFK